MKFLLLILMVSCVERPIATGHTKLTATQKEYLAGSTLEVRAYMDSCLDSQFRYFDNCLEAYKEMGKIQSSSGSSNSILKTAAGTAIGIGAAKLILGK